MIFACILFFLLVAAVAAFLGISLKIFPTVCCRKPPRHTEFDDMFSETKHRLVGTERLRSAHDWFCAAATEELCVTSHDGLALYARVIPVRSGTRSKGVVMLFHGYRSSGVRDLCLQARLLHEADYDLLVADQRSHGRSEGKYICYGIRERYDVLRWRDEALRRFGDLPICFMGLSMGAATVLMAGGLVNPQDKNVKCVVADCPFSSPHQVISHVLKTRYNIPPMPIIYGVNLWCILIAKFSMRASTSAQSMADSHLPALIFHGTADDYVPPVQSEQILEIVEDGRVELCRVKDAGHAECFFYDEKLYTEKLLDFLEKNMKR